ncbi:hypothetical protein Bbelb_434470 [Branchiostoma belcheri]|nr:hypothetical protein Bbelb_434470 [Branchiostoma belcheri]
MARRTDLQFIKKQERQKHRLCNCFMSANATYMVGSKNSQVTVQVDILDDLIKSYATTGPRQRTRDCHEAFRVKGNDCVTYQPSKLFRDCPEMIEKYPELHGMDDQEELRNSQFLQEHSQRVLDAFDHTIDSLDDVDYVIQLLKKIGQMHADLELKPDDMWKLEQPFLAAVAECLEDRYTPKFQEIYSKLITFIIEHVVNGFDPH